MIVAVIVVVDSPYTDEHWDRLPSRQMPKTMDAHYGGGPLLWTTVTVMVVVVDERWTVDNRRGG